MATIYEIKSQLDGVAKELYAIVRSHAFDVPDCAVEEIAVYLVTKELPTLDDWRLPRPYRS